MTASGGDRTPITLRAMLLPAFLPTTMFEMGNGAIIPVVALSALRLGASAGEAAFMLALMGIGRVVCDVPASSLANRLGDRRAMIAAALLGLIAFVLCFAARSLAVLGAALILVGGASAVFYLARHSYLTLVAPIRLRARVMSTLAGAHRVGLFLGPFIGAGAIALTDIRSAYLVATVTCAITAGILVLVPDDGMTGPARLSAAPPPGTRQTLADHRRLFATLGLGILAVGAVRAARQTVLPLWAGHIGVSAEATSVIFGIAGAIEMSIFYPAGKVMDNYGRLVVAVPAMIALGLTMMLLPLAHGLSALTMVAVGMALGNGYGAGIMMTLGADAAPTGQRVPFLALWRLISDSGQAAGPVAVSVVATLWSLAAAIVALGATGLLAAAALWRWTSRYSPYATPRSTRKNL